MISSKRYSSGFSVLELMLVLVLMGVLAGAVVVSLAGRHRTHELTAASKDLAAALRYAQTQAHLHRTPFQVSIDRGLTTSREGRQPLQIVVMTATDMYGQTYAPARGLSGRTYTLPASVSLDRVQWAGMAISEPPYVLQFGEADGSVGGGWLHLQNDQGERIEVEVAALSGQIDVSGVLTAGTSYTEPR